MNLKLKAKYEIFEILIIFLLFLYGCTTAPITPLKDRIKPEIARPTTEPNKQNDATNLPYNFDYKENCKTITEHGCSTCHSESQHGEIGAEFCNYYIDDQSDAANRSIIIHVKFKEFNNDANNPIGMNPAKKYGIYLTSIPQPGINLGIYAALTLTSGIANKEYFVNSSGYALDCKIQMNAIIQENANEMNLEVAEYNNELMDGNSKNCGGLLRPDQALFGYNCITSVPVALISHKLKFTNSYDGYDSRTMNINYYANKKANPDRPSDLLSNTNTYKGKKYADYIESVWGNSQIKATLAQLKAEVPEFLIDKNGNAVLFYDPVTPSKGDFDPQNSIEVQIKNAILRWRNRMYNYHQLYAISPIISNSTIVSNFLKTSDML